MSATDKFTRRSNIVIPNGTASDGIRATSQLLNNKRTEQLALVVTGQVDISVAGTGLINEGSILGALTDIGFDDGGDDKVKVDARLARFIAECLAPSPLPATRLASAGVQAATQLREIVPLWLLAHGTQQPNETKYVEVNKQSQLQAFVTPLKLITRLAEGGALAGTVTNLNVTVKQVYDDLVNIPPWLTVYQRQLVQNVDGANPALKIDLRGSRYVRGIAIQCDSDLGAIDGLIQTLILRGDAYSLYGDAAIEYQDLLDMQAEVYGGALPPGYLFIDFCRYGRLSTMWNPYQDTNVRFELGVNPAGFTNPLIRVAMIEYERTPATIGDPFPINI